MQRQCCKLELLPTQKTIYMVWPTRPYPMDLSLAGHWALLLLFQQNKMVGIMTNQLIVFSQTQWWPGSFRVNVPKQQKVPFRKIIEDTSNLEASPLSLWMGKPSTRLHMLSSFLRIWSSLHTLSSGHMNGTCVHIYQCWEQRLCFRNPQSGAPKKMMG